MLAYNPRRMHYRAIGQLSCQNCHKTWIVDTNFSEPGFIDAKSESEAAERFRLIHRLCPTCLETGTPVAVDFESYIRVENLPG
jgi:hypothetical protein